MMAAKERPLTAATVNGPESISHLQSSTARHCGQGLDLQQTIPGIDLPAVVEASGVTLAKQGARYSGLCPLHDEKTASFFVSKDQGKWRFKCFGCGAGGDAVDFVQKVYGLDFKEAIERLRLMGGFRPNSQPVQPKRKHSLRWDRYQPLTDDDAAYLKGRGLTDEIIQRFQGADILKHGTVNGKCDGIVIPLRSLPGRDLEAVQVIPVNGGKKEFQSGSRAAKGFLICLERKDSRHLVITEAAIDAMSVWQALPSANVISICGATFTSKLDQLSGDEADTITLFMDNDPAGKRAAELSAQILGTRFHDVRVVDYGDVSEKDPNDLLKAGKVEVMQRLVDEAVPLKSCLDDHPEPKPFPDELLPVEPFDFKMMPDTLAPWAKDIADRMQCQADYVAVTVMVVLGAIVGRKIGIMPKKRDDWVETPNFWAMLVGRPGMEIPLRFDSTVAPPALPPI